MKRLLYFIITFSLVLLWSSCRKDFEFSPSTGDLQFSRDTVYLDTVFTNIGSSTYNLKVYNRSNNDIVIPSVKLALGDASSYRLNVDGMSGKTFANVEILAKDSLYIFIETTVDIADVSNTKQFLYTDQIEFDGGGNYLFKKVILLNGQHEFWKETTKNITNCFNNFNIFYLIIAANIICTSNISKQKNLN